MHIPAKNKLKARDSISGFLCQSPHHIQQGFYLEPLKVDIQKQFFFRKSKLDEAASALSKLRGMTKDEAL